MPVVFDVQRFSLHDGPGIRTTVFLKGCPLRCPWCSNPESWQPQPEVAFFADRCAGCGACLDACPHGALRTAAGRIDRGRCQACCECVAACPHGALERIGREVDAGELLAEVARDRPFFEASGGGVTLSGGEPFAQPALVRALARLGREAGLSVGLQTCGAFSWRAAEPALPDLEFVHFDLKLMDPDEHRRLLGAPNRRILANAGRLLASGVPVTFRLPVVPGHTDTPGNLAAVVTFLRDHGVGSIRLLRYHTLGEAKPPRLGRSLPPLDVTADPDAALAAAADLLREQGLEVST